MIYDSTYAQKEDSSRNACVVVYQSSTDSKLLFTHVLKKENANSSRISFEFSPSRYVPLVKPENKDSYEPLLGTSLLGPQNWLTRNHSTSDRNGDATVFYQTVSGKIVASVFNPNTRIVDPAPAGPALIRGMLKLPMDIFGQDLTLIH